MENYLSDPNAINALAEESGGYLSQAANWLGSTLSPAQAEAATIQDQRRKATERSNFSGDYSDKIIGEVARAAIKNNVDPYTALAIALQESTMGRESNTAGDIGFSYRHADVPGVYERWKDAMKTPEYLMAKSRADEIQGETGVEWKEAWNKYPDFRKAVRDMEKVEAEYMSPLQAENLARVLKKQLDYGKNLYGSDAPEDLLIQAYNGYGKVRAGLYGSQNALSGSKDRPYGKRIIDLRENAIKRSPEVVAIVQSVMAENKTASR